ncbi:MAG TPA: hypothetical protein VMS95_01640 [Candidatus Krumholzibacteriaceae bacterium]|nr:hypothetical protein [Candidatus Krumholzibacteriaceae bacterium]
MVKRRPFLLALFAVFLFMVFIGPATAQRTYHVEHEWVRIWINQNGTIDLFYDISLTLDSGPAINYVYVGQPRGDFTIGTAFDQYGNALTAYEISSGDNFRVNVTLHSPLTAGHTISFNLTTNVAHMVWEDTKNAGNVGMQFTPTWWTEASVRKLNISIVLPPGITSDMVKTTQVLWNNTLTEEGRLAVYWEESNLLPDQRYPVGVSFPKQYVQYYDTQPTGVMAFLAFYGPAFLGFGILLIVVGVVVAVVRKRPYLMPQVSMETLGVRRGLTAVEASYILEMEPTRIVTEMLYSLLQKRAVWAESVNPSVKLRVMSEFQDKSGTQEAPLRYYEVDFLKAIKEDGTLDEEKLAHTVMALRDTTEQKLRGYCRRDTIDYYRKIVAKAWEQVEQAGTAELASKAYDQQLLWLLMDPNYKSRTETAFHDRIFEPSPLWWWYWFGYQHYDPHPSYKPSIDTPGQSAKPPTIPGADFANNVATAVEKTSNNIVVNLEKFANAILPAGTGKSSAEPAHHGANCVCACATCACACACVSCACACAGGGAG